MRRSRSSFRWFAGLAVVAALGIATKSQAAPHPFREGAITLDIFSLDPIVVPPTTPLASGVLNGTRSETDVTSIVFPAKVFMTTSLSIPITATNAGPIDGVLITGSNPVGNFTAMGGPAGNFGGLMPMQGTARVCLFAAENTVGCQAPALNLTLPLSKLGGPGTTTVTFLASITVKGAAWTTGTIMVMNTNGKSTYTTVSGGIEPTTAGDGSYLAVRLVTPIYISTAIPGSDTVPAWGVLSFEVPEPDLMALGLGAVGALVVVGLRRRHA